MPVTKRTRLPSTKRVAAAASPVQKMRRGALAEKTTGALAAAHLIAADPRFAPVVAEHGPISLGSIKSQPSAFSALLKTIVYQQLAGNVGKAIHGRVLAAVKADPPTPDAVLMTPYADLKGAGLSDRKVSYIFDLATHFSDGRLSDELLQTASDEDLVAALTAVKGIGPWSCQSFMIFQLERPDVLPTGDPGVQKGAAKFFGLGDKKPTPAEMARLTHDWSPFRSYGSYYMWQIAHSMKMARSKMN